MALRRCGASLLSRLDAAQPTASGLGCCWPGGALWQHHRGDEDDGEGAGASSGRGRGASAFASSSLPSGIRSARPTPTTETYHYHQLPLARLRPTARTQALSSQATPGGSASGSGPPVDAVRAARRVVEAVRDAWLPLCLFVALAGGVLAPALGVAVAQTPWQSIATTGGRGGGSCEKLHASSETETSNSERKLGISFATCMDPGPG